MRKPFWCAWQVACAVLTFPWFTTALNNTSFIHRSTDLFPRPVPFPALHLAQIFHNIRGHKFVLILWQLILMFKSLCLVICSVVDYYCSYALLALLTVKYVLYILVNNQTAHVSWKGCTVVLGISLLIFVPKQAWSFENQDSVLST